MTMNIEIEYPPIQLSRLFVEVPYFNFNCFFTSLTSSSALSRL